MTNQEIWEKLYSSRDWGKYPSLELVRFTAKDLYQLRGEKSVRILELGCGAGANLWFLAREGFETYGIDYSQSACERARRLISSEQNLKYGAKIIQGEYGATLETFDDDFFDAVVDIESLYCNNFSQSQQIISLVSKKLKTGGLFFSQTFGSETTGAEYGKELNKLVTPKTGPLEGLGEARFSSWRDLQKLYKTENLTIKKIESQLTVRANDWKIQEWLITCEKH